jgi:hypothetical protein
MRPCPCCRVLHATLNPQLHFLAIPAVSELLIDNILIYDIQLD